MAAHPSDGSIPACAGEPAPSAAVTRSAGVYPRVCGGTSPPNPWCSLATGLSPRVRGNRRNRRLDGRCFGSIPACAGEPLLRPWHPPNYGVYPRVCGGTDWMMTEPSPDYGLSPRVRGNLEAADARRVHSGSIPACAGEPLCHNDPVSHEYVKDQWTLRRSTGHAANQSPHKLRVRQRSMAGSFDNDGLDLARSGEGGVKPSPLLISAHCALPRATNWG